MGRVMLPFARCSTLTQFRTRYAQYHTDPNLLHARQMHPFINVWDDHETGNDSWMYGCENFPDSADFVPLKQAALKSYFEWIPIRENGLHLNRIYRTFRYGDLIDLIMIDTRLEGREKQLLFDSTNMAAIHHTNRTILGHEQFNWLINQLDSSTARWRIIGQQVMMAPALLFGNPLNEDQWDGYPAEREKLLEHIDQQQMNNVVILTGDVHAALVIDLPKDPSLYEDATGAGAVGVEFITPAIASSKSDFSSFPFSAIKIHDPYVQYAEFDKNGYLVLDVTEDKVQGDYYYVQTIDAPDTTEVLGASYYTLHGSRHFHRNPASAETVSYSEYPSIKIRPNPTINGRLTVDVENALEGKLIFRIFNLEGRMMKKYVMNTATAGKYQFDLNIDVLDNGVYVLKTFSGGKEIYSAKFAVAE